MPYRLQETGEGFFVVNTETGERKNKKPLGRGRAVKYMRALYAVEGGAEMGKKAKEATITAFMEKMIASKSIGSVVESEIHRNFTNQADEWYGAEKITRDERIILSSAIGDALEAFVKKIEKIAPQLYSRQLYEASTIPSQKELSPSLFIYKDASGASRWVTFSSNGYRDRDREIVSTAALEADCARADKEGSYGPLRWWHVGKPDPFAKQPGAGADIGACDFNAVHGRVLIESGTFRNERIAEAVREKANDLQVSIGYFHPLTEPDTEGVFHTIRRFERSLLPRGRASNPWTSLVFVEKEQNMLKEKIQALKALLGGDDELVQTVLAEAEKAEKAAQEAGVAFKENEDPAPDPVTETPAPEFSEAVIVADAKADDEGEAEEEDMQPVIGDMTPDDFASLLAEAMSKAMEPYQAEIKALKAGMAKKDDSEATLREALELQAQTVKQIKSQLDELTGSQPRAATKSYRASQDDATVVKETSRVKGSQPTIDPDFMKMITGNQ